jgi:hypothetical protein
MRVEINFTHDINKLADGFIHDAYMITPIFTCASSTMEKNANTYVKYY